MRERKAESISTVGSPAAFESAPLIPGSLGVGQYGTIARGSPKF